MVTGAFLFDFYYGRFQIHIKINELLCTHCPASTIIHILSFKKTFNYSKIYIGLMTLTIFRWTAQWCEVCSLCCATITTTHLQSFSHLAKLKVCLYPLSSSSPSLSLWDPSESALGLCASFTWSSKLIYVQCILFFPMLYFG